MKPPLVSASRFAEVLPVPPRASAAWNVFAVHVVESQPSAFSATFADHVITLQEFGRFRARQAVDGQAVETWCGPGCIGIIPANLDITWETHGTSEKSRATSIFVPDAFVSRVLLQDWDVDPRKVAIVRQFPHRDPVIESVLTALAIESQHGSPS